jgi:DNA polymerase-3 subunit epsilon
MKNLNFVAVDFETADLECEAPIRFGYSIVRDGIIIENDCININPEVEIHSYLKYLLDVDDPDFYNEPTFPIAWPRIRQILESSDFVISHGTTFDFNILTNVLNRYNLNVPVIEKIVCSMVSSRKIFRESPSHAILWLAPMLGLKWFAWRAIDNSKLSAQIFIEIMKRSGCDTIDDFCEVYNVEIGSLSPELGFKKCISKRVYKPRPSYSYNIEGLIQDESKIDEDHLLYAQNVAFTGKLSRLTRLEAMQMVLDIGGIPKNSVSKETDFLVVGQQDYRIVGEDGMSSKQEKAIKYKESGIDIEILSEEDFIGLF